MGIRYLNCFTCNARWLADWKTGTLCLLVETRQGLVLVDTGLGREDYIHPPAIVRLFRMITDMPFDPQEAAVRQIERLGYRPEDIRHIVLTHMHFDHCGGLADFPHARVHVHRRELEAFTHGSLNPFDAAYVRCHIAHGPDFVVYEDFDGMWFDFHAVRLPFTPQIWLIPLHYHTNGHCGVAIETDTGWHLHCGDAAGDFRKDLPSWAIRLVLGPYAPRLRAFGESHPKISLTASHMFLDFFESSGR
jgi:glyoxylase-like metal-dependent hydrolase (beta-lactamase superfamily II)